MYPLLIYIYFLTENPSALILWKRAVGAIKNL